MVCSPGIGLPSDFVNKGGVHLFLRVIRRPCIAGSCKSALKETPMGLFLEGLAIL